MPQRSVRLKPMRFRRRFGLDRRCGLLLFISSLGLLEPAAAVVCPFTNFMPNGPHAVGHAEAWIDAANGAPPLHVQWWFPAKAPPAESLRHFHLGDALLSSFTDPTLPAEAIEAAARRSLAEFSLLAKNRGAPAVRFDHVRAAAMLAIHDAEPLPGPWPLVWVGGDVSFADQLAAHGMVTVSSPRIFGRTADFERELAAATTALQLSAERYDIDPKRIGALGLNEQAALAARLAGSVPELHALALVGAWTLLADNKVWFDPAEIQQPTLYIHADAPVMNAGAHPLAAPFAAVDDMRIGDIENVQLEFGLHNHCAAQYAAMSRPVSGMLLLQTQYALRSRLAQFFSAQFDLVFAPAKMRVPPILERQQQRIEIEESQLAARLSAPPQAAAITALLDRGGVSALLDALPVADRELYPSRWWLFAYELADARGPEVSVAVLHALDAVQPESGLAATLFAERAAASGSSKAARLRKRALGKVDQDPRLSPPLQAELRARLNR